ncbi:hypothetical protein LmYK1_05840 [Ligilactobacillus murinus]|uniref:G5 domain-containing protein n=1 Tax=Ligilactobacillus murinus TaxID=1622 RepID=UPI002573EC4C|nr:ZmpA/ZmpB/ZmpC family metallo-endopeptidase [Ligilactobacillus murinus]BDI01344.1 hypothetical protein LmYK1_05840 [Ligilactobacillus murinus]
MSKSNRSKWQIGEQKQRFAIRKFSQGVCSVLVGTIFVFGTPAVIQGDEIVATHIGTKKKEQYQIKFQHVTEASLTSEQRAKVIYDNPPKTKVSSDQVYYLVYRPVATQHLPQTGELEMPWELGAFGAGALIMGLGVLPRRGRKYRFLTAIIVASTVVGVGSSVVSASPSFAELSNYDRAYLVAEDEELPEIATQHVGYQYIGYLLVSDIKHHEESVPTTRPVTEKLVPNSDKISNTDSLVTGMDKPEIPEETTQTVDKETKTEPVGYETQYVADPELLEGTTSLRTPGQAGERTIVYEVTRDATGKEIRRVEKSNTITKAPVTEVIAQGTKVKEPEESKVTVSEESKVESVGYETQYVTDPELLEGTTSVRTPGQAGERTIVYEVTRDATGKEIRRVEKSNTITKAPVTEVIAQGTKVKEPEEPKVTVSEETKVESVSYETQYVADPELLEGTTSVRTPGQAGERTIVYEVTRDATGKEISRIEKSNTITKAPVTEVIARGTKVKEPEESKVTVSEETKVESVGYETQYVADPELLEGTTSVRTPGQAGERTIVYEVTRDATGKEISRVEKSNTITKAPVTEVIARGTKVKEPEVTVSEESQVESVGYETQYVADPELLEGTTSVRTPGQAGERTIVYEVTRDATGKEISRVEKSNTITKAPVTEVIARGTKVKEPEEPKVTVSEESQVESVGYETQYVADPELLEGTTSVRTPGQVGERTIVYEVTRDATGKEISRVEKSNTITKAPVTEVIARGTKVKEPEVTVSEESQVESVGYETQYVADPELLEGTTSVRTPGQAGERTIVYEVTRDATGKEISRVEKSNTITKAPVTEVIAQGTKPKTTVTEEVLVEKIPYTSELQSDPELFVGTTVVKTAGQVGERTIVYEVTRDTNGKELARVEKSNEITKVPVNEVVAKGTKLYAKPLVELASTDESVDNRVATVSYTVTDPNKKLQAIKVSLYKENEKITEKLVDLTTLTTTFADLAYNTNYRLETEYTYDIGQGDQTENLKPITVELTPKKVELKNVDNISLYQLGKNGGLELVSSLAELPTDPNKYVAKIVSRQQKDWYLPVTSFEEIKLGEKTKYQATIATPELVTYQADKRDFSTGHTFLIDKTEVSNEYTNFAELIKAIKADPTGDFILAADLDALGFASSDADYITETFSGTLRSKAGNSYTIYNLNKPLFNVVKGATIANILLENVAITDNVANTGSLARVLDGALISDVNIKGTIASTQTTGGLAARIKNNTQISRASFTGTITLTGNAYDQGGGLVGYAENSRIARSFADVYLTAKVHNTNDNVGGLVGRLASGVLEKSYATGTIKNDGLVKRAGGLIGSAWTNGRVVDAISAVKMENGYIFHGDVDFKRPPHQKTYYVSEVASGLTNDYPTAITEATAKEMLQNWQVAAPTWKAATVAQIIDYSQLPNYQAERELVYRNMEKLLPFYDRYTILKYGNKVLPSDKLYTTALKAVVPMKAGKVVGDSVVEPGQLTSLLLHFADETVTQVALEFLGEYKQTNISEYQFANGLLYTPYQLGGAWNDLLTEVVTAYQTLDYYAAETTASLALQPTEDSLKKAKKTALENYQKIHPTEVLTAEKTAAIEAKAVEQLRIEQLNELYLQDAFAKVQKDIKAQLGSLTTSMAVVDLNSAVIREDLKQRLEAKKLELTLALAYLERLYHINYGELDLHALAAYYPDFYGKRVDILSWLSDFSKLGTKLAVKNNYATYAALFSPLTGDQDVVTYLEHNRRLFAPQLDDNTWFKEATKAYVYEASSKQVPDATVQIYDRLKGKNRLEYRNYLLPLLNLSEKNMFMFTTMTTVSFGIYERYIDEALKSDPTVYAAKQANIDRAVDKYAQIMADYYDTWYRIVDDKVKAQLLTRDIPLWDGYWIIDNTKTGNWNNRWVDKFDKAVSGVYEFFAPVGKMYAPNGVGAYATGSLVHFVVDGQLSDYGVAVSSHEMTHNLDGAVYFNGYGRRQEMGAETFAMGLLEVPSTPGQGQYGLNLAFDWSNKKNLTQASSFSDFTLSADLKRYMKGVFDVTYLLDYAEAQAIIAMSNDDRRQYLRQITYDTNAKQDKITNSGLTYAESIKLTNWESLIDNNIVVARSLSGGSYGKNTYMTVPLYAPIYAGLQNDNGSVGGLLFRKTAFELLADRGWEDGFIPYVSNQYKNQAEAEGEVFSDAYIFKQIWGTEYANYAEFKKAMFNERIAKKDNLKAITITYNKKQETIDSFAKLQTLMDQASAADMLLMRAGKRAVNVDNLKKAIMVEYHALTDSFKSSIFN